MTGFRPATSQEVSRFIMARWGRDVPPEQMKHGLEPNRNLARRTCMELALLGATFELETSDDERDISALRIRTFPEVPTGALLPEWEGVLCGWAFCLEGAADASLMRLQIELRVRESAVAFQRTAERQKRQSSPINIRKEIELLMAKFKWQDGEVEATPEIHWRIKTSHGDSLVSDAEFRGRYQAETDEAKVAFARAEIADCAIAPDHETEPRSDTGISKETPVVEPAVEEKKGPPPVPPAEPEEEAGPDQAPDVASDEARHVSG